MVWRNYENWTEPVLGKLNRREAARADAGMGERGDFKKFDRGGARKAEIRWRGKGGYSNSTEAKLGKLKIEIR